ncbi:hypothetical protein MCEWOLH11_00935 [Candidatus Methylopumilus universalis]
MIFLVGCGKNKQDIVDKCLLQANQTFPTDLSQKSMFFQGCMVEYKYAFNAHNCDKDKQVHMLSEICYVKY